MLVKHIKEGQNMYHANTDSRGPNKLRHLKDQTYSQDALPCSEYTCMAHCKEYLLYKTAKDSCTTNTVKLDCPVPSWNWLQTQSDSALMEDEKQTITFKLEVDVTGQIDHK